MGKLEELRFRLGLFVSTGNKFIALGNDIFENKHTINSCAGENQTKTLFKYYNSRMQEHIGSDRCFLFR